MQDTLIIDTSNAHAAPGPSRGYACLRVAFPSIGTPGSGQLWGCFRGWGVAGLGAYVPLSADPVALRVPPTCGYESPFSNPNVGSAHPVSYGRGCRWSNTWLPALRGTEASGGSRGPFLAPVVKQLHRTQRARQGVGGRVPFSALPPRRKTLCSAYDLRSDETTR